MRAKSKKKRGKSPPPESSPFPYDKARSLLGAAALAVLTYLAFSNSFSAGFVLDNTALLLQDPRIRELTGENIRLILQHTYWWPTGEAGLYRPLTTLSYLINYAVLGNATAPAGYHWINFLLHLGNVLLVYALTRRLLSEFWPAFFAAALWAVHPVLTESVTNMIGRSDLLSAMAVLSGFLMYLKSAESSGGRRLAWLAGLMAATALGVFSKESGVVIIGVIALYELTWWKERKQGRALLLGCLATLLPIALMLYQRSRVLAASKPAEYPFFDNPIVGVGFWTGRLTAMEVIPRYLWLTLWPARLSIDYSYAQIPLAQGGWQDWLACLAVLAAAFLVVGLYWWNCTAFFLASFAAITFAPMSNLLFPIGTIMAERFLYMPTIGLLTCLVMGIYAGGRRVPVKHFATAILCVITAAFAVRTRVRNGDWQNDRAMAEASIRSSPNSYKVHDLLASLLYGKGVAEPNLDGAIAEGDRAVEILDSLPDSRNNAQAYSTAGNFHLAKAADWGGRNRAQSEREAHRAVQLLTRAIAIDKSGRAEYDRRGGAEWARRHSTVGASAKPDAEPFCALAVAYRMLGNTEGASAAASQSLALHPVDAEAYRQISYIFYSQARIDDAASALIEGALITGDYSLKTDLLNLDGAALSNSCAVTNGPRGPELNVTCDRVKKQFCAASLEVVKAFMERDQPDEARRHKQDFRQNFDCPAGPLDQILPN